MAAMRVLVAGWFSFADGHATAGDLLNRDVTCEWLDQAGCAYDVAVAAPFPGGVDWRQLDPSDYSHVVFVCGPFERRGHELEFLARFHQCRLIGLNLSMIEPLSTWNPFDVLWERDSSECVRPDLAFLSPLIKVPVVGICLVEDYPGSLVKQANEVIRRLVNSREMAVVSINTRLDAQSQNICRTPVEVESLISRVDLLLTTRLHGMVLALKHGVPAVAIDPEFGGAKIARQANLLGWPLAFNVDEANVQALDEALQYGLTPAARELAQQCSARARAMLNNVSAEFIAEIHGNGVLEERYQKRLADPKPHSSQPSDRCSQSGNQRVRATWAKLRSRLRFLTV